jgi:hypothetical protein
VEKGVCEDMTTPEHPDTIKSLADLRPGDLMFSTIGGFIPGVFPVKAGQLMLGEHVRIGRRSFDHVGIVVEASQNLPPGTMQNLETGQWHSGGLPGRDQDWGVEYQTYDTGVITAPRLVQAMPGGAEEIELRQATHWTDTVSYVRLSEDCPGQAADAAAIARLFVSEGVRYSFLSYGALAAWKWGFRAERLARWISRTRPAIGFQGTADGYGDDDGRVALPVEAICSVLVDQCWTLAGHRVVTGTRPQIVTPGMLAMQLWNRPGVIRGGRGILW